MFRFAAHEWLPALLLVPVLVGAYWLAAASRRRALGRFAEPRLAAKLTQSVSTPARWTRSFLRVAAVGLIVLALARPQFGTRVETVRSVGRDIVVAVDLSRSMLAEDVSPNRLDRARLAILRLLGRLDGDRIGLVAFAADAFVQSPLTIDYGAAAMFLRAMQPDLMPVQGTDLGEAMRVSLDALDQGAREDRVLVIVTDGEDHEGSMDEQLERAARSGVTVHTVGIGSAEGVPVPDVDDQGRQRGFRRDADGNVVTTRLDETTLRRIAEETGGEYVRAGAGGTAFDDLVDRIATGGSESADSREVTQFEEQYRIFLGLALVLLLMEAVMPERTRFRGEWEGRFA